MTNDATSSDPTSAAAEAAARLRELTGVERHDVAVVLGSGWGPAVDLIGETVAEIAVTDLPGFAPPAVEGHAGRVRSVRLGTNAAGASPAGAAGSGTDGGERRALVFLGRTHLYEGLGVAPTVHGVRTAVAAGVSVVVLTNASGGLHLEWGPGTPVLISDHLNLTGRSPLVGAQFVDLTDLYAQRLRDLAHRIEPELPEGVYAQLPGPHYETPAEVRMVQRLGGDLVGMSTGLEAIAARAAGAEVLGISLVTNPAAGLTGEPLNHEEVLAAARDGASRMGELLGRLLPHV